MPQQIEDLKYSITERGLEIYHDRERIWNLVIIEEKLEDRYDEKIQNPLMEKRLKIFHDEGRI